MIEEPKLHDDESRIGVVATIIYGLAPAVMVGILWVGGVFSSIFEVCSVLYHSTTSDMCVTIVGVIAVSIMVYGLFVLKVHYKYKNPSAAYSVPLLVRLKACWSIWSFYDLIRNVRFQAYKRAFGVCLVMLVFISSC